MSSLHFIWQMPTPHKCIYAYSTAFDNHKRNNRLIISIKTAIRPHQNLLASHAPRIINPVTSMHASFVFMPKPGPNRSSAARQLASWIYIRIELAERPPRACIWSLFAKYYGGNSFGRGFADRIGSVRDTLDTLVEICVFIWVGAVHVWMSVGAWLLNSFVCLY